MSIQQGNKLRDLGLKQRSQGNPEFMDQYNAALSSYDSAIQESESWEAYYNKAVALFDVKDLSGAIECANKAFVLNPKYKPISVLRDYLLSL
jgi:tetratricopeptide (TPR) repeat protein